MTSKLWLLPRLQLQLFLSVAVCSWAVAEPSRLELATPKYLRYSDALDFRCPAPLLGMDGTWMPTAALQRQRKLGIRASFGDYTIETDDHLVQLCYQTGQLETTNTAEFDVTLVTFGTIDRLSTLADTVDTWNGLVSLAVYVCNDTELDTLNSFLNKHVETRQRLTVHIVSHDGNIDAPFPVNVLRNVALIGVSTTHFLYLDMDFVPSAGSRDEILKHQQILKETASGMRRDLLVLPALECRRRLLAAKCRPLENQYNSMSLQEIKKYVRMQLFDLFAGGKRGYHTATELDTWQTAEKPYVLPVAGKSIDVSPNFEPYTVLPTRIVDNDGSSTPMLLWDEIFTDYGRNKIIFLNMLRTIFDYGFMVLPNICVFHKRHTPTQNAAAFKQVGGPKDQIIQIFDARMDYWQQISSGLAMRDFSDHTLIDLSEMPKVIRLATGDSRDPPTEVSTFGDNDWRKPIMSPLLSNNRLLVGQIGSSEHDRNDEVSVVDKDAATISDIERVEKKLNLAPSTLRLRVVEEFADYFEEDMMQGRRVSARAKESFERRAMHQLMTKSDARHMEPYEPRISVLCQHWISIGGLKSLLIGVTLVVIVSSLSSIYFGRVVWKGRRMMVLGSAVLVLTIIALDLFQSNCAISL